MSTATATASMTTPRTRGGRTAKAAQAPGAVTTPAPAPAAVVVVDRKELLGELTCVRAATDSRTSIPILSHVLLTAHRNGAFTLVGCDLDVTLRTSVVASSGSGEGALSVSAKNLRGVINSLAPGDVQLSLFDGDAPHLLVESGTARFRMPARTAEAFPNLPTVESDVCAEVDSALLRRMIHGTAFAISTEESRFQLNGALLVVAPESVSLVSTDGHRLAVAEAPAGEGVLVVAGVDSTLVPRKAIAALVKMTTKGDRWVSYRRGEKHLAFRCGRRELFARILEGTFPDYKRVIAKLPVRVTVGRAAFSQAVGRVEQMVDERSVAVVIRVSGEQMDLEVTSSDRGRAGERVPCQTTGAKQPFDVAFNPAYLHDALGATDSDEVEIELKSAETMGIFRPVNGDTSMSHLCVVMPMHAQYVGGSW